MRGISYMEHIHAMQDQAAGKGMLQINVTSAADSRPVQGALVSFRIPESREQTLEQIVTGQFGTERSTHTGCAACRMEPGSGERAAALLGYTLDISAPGFEPVSIAGTEILADVKALQNVQ